MDTKDTTLGFFVRWVEVFSSRFQKINVVCLKKGDAHIPDNVALYSLGKENLASEPRGMSRIIQRLVYAYKGLHLVLSLRNDYDTVFVHMNQEYILLYSWLWRLMGKKVFLWRNHYAGSFFTDVAVTLSHGVFCTSRYSYTARFQKAKIMPVGSDTNYLADMPDVQRVPRSILISGRVSSSKRSHLIIEALGVLAREGVHYTADFYGKSSSEEGTYREGLLRRINELGLSDRIKIHDAVPSTETKYLYASHEFVVNASPSGMLDKTMFSAMGRLCILVACNKDLEGQIPHELLFEEDNLESLVATLRHALNLTEAEKEKFRIEMKEFVFTKHSLISLADALSKAMK